MISKNLFIYDSIKLFEILNEIKSKFNFEVNYIDKKEYNKKHEVIIYLGMNLIIGKSLLKCITEEVINIISNNGIRFKLVNVALLNIVIVLILINWGIKLCCFAWIISVIPWGAIIPLIEYFIIARLFGNIIINNKQLYLLFIIYIILNVIWFCLHYVVNILYIKYGYVLDTCSIFDFS